MDGNAVFPLVLGGLFGGGAYLAALGTADALRQPNRDVKPLPSAPGWPRRGTGAHPVRRIAVTGVAGAAALALTGWPVALPLGAAAGWYLPTILGPDRQTRAQVERLEAVAGWTEQLRDTLAAASGLEQALQSTAAYAPLPIRPQISVLAERLNEGSGLTDALRLLAAELREPVADTVVVALINASERQVGRLGDLLAALAATAREQARMQIRAAAARAQVRTAVRMIVATTLLLIGGLVLFDPAYMSPYGTVPGQLLLLAVAGLFALAFVHLGRLSQFRVGDRLLDLPEPSPSLLITEVP